MEEKNINEKVKEKVETKSSNKYKAVNNIKNVDVLVYNARTQTAIVSVDGFGYEFKNVTKDPGKSVRVKVSGRSKTSNYKLELA
mgnify:CR=1 FL=1